jgi:hypothetical protein
MRGSCKTELRSDDDPNCDGVAKLLRGQDDQVKTLEVGAGILKMFVGKNTGHKVSAIRGTKERMIAVFSYFDRPGLVFTKEDQIGFHGRGVA